jgi:hypothetical protein
MKKKLFVLGMFMMAAFYSFSQFELKIDPVSALFGNIPLAAEYIITENIGVEATVGYSFGKDKNFESSTSAQGLVVAGLVKYYFKPDDGGDRFYFFPYVRNANRKFTFTDDIDQTEVEATYKAFGVGFGIGYKVVAESGLLFDFGFGVGKNFSGGYTYSDPDYTEEDDFFIPINLMGRISIGYRFGGK